MTPTSPMTAVYTAVTTFLTNIVAYMESLVTEITGNDVLIVFILAIPLVSFAVGLLARLVKRSFR